MKFLVVFFVIIGISSAQQPRGSRITTSVEGPPQNHVEGAPVGCPPSQIRCNEGEPSTTTIPTPIVPKTVIGRPTCPKKTISVEGPPQYHIEGAPFGCPPMKSNCKRNKQSYV